jgi:predicted TIM-barrel fold metal-dependent hydrolase
MQLIDTHQHLWDLAQLPYSWCAAIPALNRSFSPEDYQLARREAEEKHGVEICATVHVEADVDEPHSLDELRWLQEVATAGRAPIHALVAGCRPERDDFQAQLEALEKFPLVKGVRRVLHTQPDELSQSTLFSDNLNLLPQRDYSFDLCVLARQLPVAINLVKRCPNVSFVLDHCGVPDVAGGALQEWRDHVRVLASHQNVACKISGLPAYAAANWTPDDLRPFIDHVFETFGATRVIWGSDWPVCNLGGGFSRWVEACLTLTQSCTEEERRQLFHDNAQRIYRLETV